MTDSILTLALSASAGIILVIIANKFLLPSIVLLLAGGIILGPELLGLVNPETLGHGLDTVVALTIAVILFEGGLTLDVSGYKKSSSTIKKMLTIGPLITWFGTGAAVYYIFNVTPALSLMISSLVIVTGPTVVFPILRRINVKEKLHHVLYWEGVLIDVIGVFIAVMSYKWLIQTSGDHFLVPLGKFAMRIVLGTILGIISGLIISYILKKEIIQDEHTNIFVLAGALLVYSISHSIIPESGILTVVISGLVIAIKHPPHLRKLKRFKLQLTEAGIGMIFILLAAKLELNKFSDIRLLYLLIIMIFIIRPLVVFISTWKNGFSIREKLFLSWIAPRGIVAASMASLFALRLKEKGFNNAELLETVAYSVVIVTVTLQGLTAPFVAKLLKVKRVDKKRWVLFGESNLIKSIGKALRKGGIKTVEIDTSNDNDDTLNIDDPVFNDVNAVFFADSSANYSINEIAKTCFEIRASNYYRWSSFTTEQLREKTGLPSTPVWMTTSASSLISAGLESHQKSIDIIETGSKIEKGRFGKTLMPLFWIDNGTAHIIKDPLDPGEPVGDMAVVLRQKKLGLKQLISHVEVVIENDANFKAVLDRLVVSANRQFTKLADTDIIEGIFDRSKTMTAAIGGGIAIPHAYWEGVSRSTCFMAVIPNGVSGITVPDEKTIRLVFLLLSPKDQAANHLESLAALASLGHEKDFVDLLCRQKIPAKIISLISERD